MKMTDKGLYEHIRKLVKEKKKQANDSSKPNFAEDYCNRQLQKKRLVRSPQNIKMKKLNEKLNNIDSFVNVFDILAEMPILMSKESTQNELSSNGYFPKDILPKSLQQRIKMELKEQLNCKYQEEAKYNNNFISPLESTNHIKANQYCNCSTDSIGPILKSLSAKDHQVNANMEIIQILRENIKKKEFYERENKFYKQIEEVNTQKKNLQNTKIFHKVCSYLHMALEDEHRSKWASRKEQKFRQTHDGRLRTFKIPTMLLQEEEKIKQNLDKGIIKSRYKELTSQNIRSTENGFNSLMSSSVGEGKAIKQIRFEDVSEEENCDQIYSMSNTQKSFKSFRLRKQESKSDEIKKSFTFLNRGIKRGIMSEIKEFVNNLNEKQNKNRELSKKYSKALQSLQNQIITSYGKFNQENIAEEEDIKQLKKYLDLNYKRLKKKKRDTRHQTTQIM